MAAVCSKKNWLKKMNADDVFSAGTTPDIVLREMLLAKPLIHFEVMLIRPLLQRSHGWISAKTAGSSSK